ncbi:hypothetical protein THAOC_04630 [Thalassiosira oceanica]|uniref:Methyltransferase FkbM domain-containing protein n=1 Tax=Thalassiosira oceanica TaxID=159749 RepID=K0T9J3_THAOC|nr:hypothetical protein THAOC_04630 [Thalassiosira oceanica]|eukprot:EJK73729.1 hypothetical protein THAOC_04630 [Thalassiosira oceanica]
MSLVKMRVRERRKQSAVKRSSIVFFFAILASTVLLFNLHRIYSPVKTNKPSISKALLDKDEEDAERRSATVKRWSSVSGAVSAACSERSDNGVRPCVQSLLDFAKNSADGVFPSLRAVQVGACDGDFRQEPGDLFQEVVLASSAVDVILVEAVPSLFERLVTNLSPWLKMRGREDSLVPLNAAMCPPKEDASIGGAGGDGHTLPFFSTSPQFAEDHPEAKHWEKYQLGSVSSDEDIVNKVLQYEKKATLEGASEEELKATVREKYVTRTDVPCFSPEMILAAGRSRPWSPRSVDVLMVDTEGVDDVVVNAWLSLPGFLPALLIYEHTHVKEPRATALRGRLRERGYDCKVSVPNRWADTICILEVVGI